MAVAGPTIIVGIATGRSPMLALVLALAVLAGTLTLRSYALPLIIVLAAAYGVQRLGPARVNLSVADGALLVATLAALLLAPWDSARLRKALVAAVVYEGLLAVAVLSHPTTRSIMEWGHRILLVIGAMLVGATLAKVRRMNLALQLYVAVSTLVAFAACAYAAARNLSPAYPFGIQKNAAGELLAVALLVTIFVPGALKCPSRLLTVVQVLLIVGLLSTQSRAAMLSVIVVLAADWLRRHHSRRALALALVAAISMGAVTLVITQAQNARAKNDPNSSRFYGIGAREVTYKQALTIWKHEPIVGAGLRYFNSPVFGTSEPHDIVIVSLAETGIIGLAALVFLLVSTWTMIRRLDGEVAGLARATLLVHLLIGVVNIYWVAGTGSFCWVIIGAAVSGEIARAVPGKRNLDRSTGSII